LSEIEWRNHGIPRTKQDTDNAMAPLRYCYRMLPNDYNSNS
jgi:hypothetical protein